MGKFESYPETHTLGDNDITLYNHTNNTNKITFINLVNLIKTKLQSIGIIAIDTGVGLLSDGTITSNGTIKCDLKSETPASISSANISTVDNRQYAVGVDKDGHLSVNVPWEGSSTTYSAGNGINIINNTISTKLKSNTQSLLTASSMGSTSNRQYAVGLDSQNYLSVNIPWVEYSAGKGIILNNNSHNLSANLKSYTQSSLASTSMGSTANRQYAVGLDKDGYLSVNVPWEGGSTTYTAGSGIDISSNTIKVKLKSYTQSSLTSASITSIANRQYAVGLDSSGNLSVNVPWENTLPNVTGVKGSSESTYRTGNINITAANIGLGNVGNYKAVSTVANQGLTDTEKANARANIGAGTSSFSGSYTDLTNKPTIPTVNNATLTIQKNGTNVQTFTANQASNATANITVPTKTSELTNDSGYTTNTGTVTRVQTGVGLVGNITTSGTIKTKLKSETASTLSSTSMGSTANRQYAVGLDKDGYLSVNIPWNNTIYTANNGVKLSNTIFSANLKSNTLSSLSSTSMGTATNRQYAVGLDKDGYLSVNVPWVGGSSGDAMLKDGSNAASEVIFNGKFTVGSRKANSTHGTNSVAEGIDVAAEGDYSHAEGRNTNAIGNCSHAEGYNTTANGNYAHAEGTGTTASGYSHAEGGGTTAEGSNSHAECYNTKAIGNFSHAEGSGTTASGRSAHSEGNYTCANEDGSHAEGYSEATPYNLNRTVKGLQPATHPIAALGVGSHAEGCVHEGGTTSDLVGAIQANGEGSHAEGYSNMSSDATVAFAIIASGKGAHAEGYAIDKDVFAIGNGSHAEGKGTTARGHYSHAEGNGTTASSNGSHAEGYLTTAQGNYSHAEGIYTTADYDNQHVSGKFNSNKSTTLFEVGNGSSSSNRSNAFEVYSDGSLSTDNGTTKVKLENLALKSEINTFMTKSNPTGTGSFSLNRKSGTTVGDYSFAEGLDTTASGYYSHAEGYNTTASKIRAHAEGNITIASGENSHAEGSETTASGNNSHAEGNLCQATSSNSHAEGNNCTASGTASHAEGHGTTARGMHSHAEGNGCTASSSYSHAEGYETITSGSYSHAEGYKTKVNQNGAHAEGYDTIANSTYSHVEGEHTESKGVASHSEGCGYQSTDIGSSTPPSEYDNTATKPIYSKGKGSHAEGCVSAHYIDESSITVVGILQANGDGSHVEGYAGAGNSSGMIIASGQGSHAEGYVDEGEYNIASGPGSHVEGSETTASGNFSHAEGATTVASGGASHAEGFNTTANGYYSHTEGQKTKAEGSSSHAEGEHTTAQGNNSHAGGAYGIASRINQFVQGGGNQYKNDGRFLVNGFASFGFQPDYTLYNSNTVITDGQCGCSGGISGTAVTIDLEPVGMYVLYFSLYDYSGDVVDACVGMITATGNTHAPTWLLINQTGSSVATLIHMIANNQIRIESTGAFAQFHLIRIL